MGLTTRVHDGMSCKRTGYENGRPTAGRPVRFRGR
ncbi:hypothetical protein SAMN02745947_00900 [Rhodococcus rhodochrous J3]|uniref:Uncharacterized protein n=1 Tax=Rhodococcus rhodochrous J3 TaxID=903528 RepID=A0ABY1M6M7_RHORH|nr:hypothetical protein L612_000900000830 [Rhodococcus rhodochrous J38]SMG18059.1 hypothetical protein SAMN02745947_00900 [Rhodococcus rhodochrous J3]SNV20702.1 Uncharacterised protein [Rhodococcus rhodochrous]